MDLKSAFLNADLEEKVYMHQLQGFQVPGKEHSACRLKKALYGLNQSPKVWYIKIDRYLKEWGFRRCPFNRNLYIKRKNGDVVILMMYVEGIIITGSEAKPVAKVKSKLCLPFDMTDLGLLHYSLGV